MRKKDKEEDMNQEGDILQSWGELKGRNVE